MADDILARLKAATAAAHERVEGQVGFLGGATEYSAYLAKLLGFHAPLEAELRGFSVHPWLQGRDKVPLLEQDLRALAVEPSGVPRCAFTPRISSEARALGCSYVLEGATLGGKHVLRQLNGRVPAGATAYLACYGPEVGARWNAFRDGVRAQVSASEAGECIAAAVETFEALSRWLAR